MAAGGGRAGTGYIEIRPELVSDFAKTLERDVDKKVKPVEVPVEPDTEGGAKKAGDGISSWSTDAAFTGAAGAVGAVAGKFIVDGMASWIEEDKGASRIAAALGLDATNRSKVELAARQVYVDGFGGSLAEAQLSVEAVGSSVIDISATSQTELVKMAEAAQVLADAFGVDVAYGASVAGQMSEEFGLSGMQSLDMLAASLTGVDMSLRGDVLVAIDEYAPMLREMGYSAEEAFGVFATAAQEGKFELDKMPDAIKELHNRMLDFDHADSNAGLAALGFPDPAAFKRRIMAGGDEAKSAINQLLTELDAKKNDPRAKQWAMQIFGTQFEDMASIDTLTLLKPIDDALGATEGKAQQLGATISDNTSGSFDRGMRTMETEWNAGLDRLVSSPGESLGALVEQFETNFMHIAGSIGRNLGPPVYDFVFALPGHLGAAVDKVEEFVGEVPGWLGGVWEQIEDMFGKIPEAMGKIFDGLEGLFLDPLKSAWNGAAGWFNGLTFPTMGPWDIDAGFFGSYTIGPYGGWDLPDLPMFDRGGVVPGTVGSPQLVLAHGGETVLPTHKPGGGMAGGVTVNQTINTVASPSEVAQVSTALLMRRIRPR